MNKFERINKKQVGGNIEKLDNTYVSNLPIKYNFSKDLLSNTLKLIADNNLRKNQTYLNDLDRVEYNRNLLNFTNQNYFGYGVFGNLQLLNPATLQEAILSNFDYAVNNVRNFSDNIAGVGVAGVTSKAINKGTLVYSKLFKGPFKAPTKRGSLGTMKLYTKNGTIGLGSEAVVINNTPTTVGKITTIPLSEMAARNAIPNTVQSLYVGYVKDQGTKFPTYILRKVKTLTTETFPRYINKLDDAMQRSGFRRVNDPNVLYRAYTNGSVVIDDVAPGNVGLDLFRRPKMIDFNLLTIPEWIALGYTLKNGGKLPNKSFQKGGIIEPKDPTKNYVTLEDYGKIPDLNKIVNYAILTTHYPVISKSYPFTGHSDLKIATRGNSLADYNEYFIDKRTNKRGYNFVTNNCSDATRCALEYTFGKKDNPIMFTTPGDTRDFALSKLGGFPIINKKNKNMVFDIWSNKYIYDSDLYQEVNEQLKDLGYNLVVIPLTSSLEKRLIEYIKNGNRNNDF